MRVKTNFLLTLSVALSGFTLVSLACSVTTHSPIIVVTATPSQIIVLPTAVPQTVAPTLSNAPNVVLVQADTALRNGNYDAAVSVYQSILDQQATSVDAQLRADAAFGLGAAALREGKFTDALVALTHFIEAYPNDSHSAQAYFLRGDAYMGINDWKGAIANFQLYLQKRPGWIDSYAYERIGDAYLALNDPANALSSYAQAVGGGSSSLRGLGPLLTLREKVAAAYLNAGNLKAAVEQYDAILSASKSLTAPNEDTYRAGIALQAANALANAGDPAAVERYQAITTTYPTTPAAYQAMLVLLKDNIKVESFLHGKISFAAQDYNDAITALYNYTSNTPLSKIDPVVYMMLGRAYREAGNTAAANTSFQTIIDQYPTSTYYGDAWLEQGRTLFLGKKVQEAIARYKELAEKHPDVPQGAEALWRAGYLYSTLGDTESSLATFEILGTKYKGTDWAMDGLFRAGMAAYNQKANARAERLFALLASTGNGNLKAAGFLWLGRLYQIEKQTQLARQAYAEASNADPGGYYSLRANDLLAGHGPFVPPAKIDWAFNSPAQIAQAEQWMRQTFKITQTGDLWQLSPTLAADPRMIRGTELWAVAAYDNAQGEFKALIDDNQTTALALYQLASYFYGIGLYHEAILACAKLLDNAKIQTMNAPKYIAALRFPIAYYDLVLPVAKKYNLDPLLMFSLIRQESLFQGIVTSSASAQGLMQIIPTTGDYIATKLKWPDYQSGDLYRPYINVEFGAYYLAEQLKTFDGNIYAALAAYNAGPGATAEWLRISNGDPDLFIQAIEFTETQTYVRRIYEIYGTYVSIYGAH